ncbi:hypothetical protein M8C21_010013, partial [Ambrosia artemisiifolia]
MVASDHKKHEGEDLIDDEPVIVTSSVIIPGLSFWGDAGRTMVWNNGLGFGGVRTMEHEEALVDAIAKLEGASDGES